MNLLSTFFHDLIEWEFQFSNVVFIYQLLSYPCNSCLTIGDLLDFVNTKVLLIDFIYVTLIWNDLRFFI